MINLNNNVLQYYRLYINRLIKNNRKSFFSLSKGKITMPQVNILYNSARIKNSIILTDTRSLSTFLDRVKRLPFFNDSMIFYSLANNDYED